MILSWLLGRCHFRVKEELITAFAELCRARGILLYGGKRDAKNGTYSFHCRPMAAKRLRVLCHAAGIPLTEEGERGLPSLVRRFLHRPGCVVGGVLAFLVLVLSPLFAWDIEITGNVAVPAEEIEASLALSGLSRGSFLPGKNTDAVANALRRADARLGYVGVRVRGTVVCVQVAETDPEPPPTVTAPANLIAARDGVVTLPLVFEGRCLVREGEVVRAGQLLASGLTPTDNNGTLVTRASGEVLARTVRTYTVQVSSDYTVLMPTERPGREFGFFFFGKSGKLFKSTGNSTDKCDIINYVYQPQLPGGRRLPFGITEKRTVWGEEVTLTRSVATALEAANAELNAKIAEDCRTVTVLSRRVETLTQPDGVTLICTLTCEENIAVTAEFAPGE